MTITEIQNNAKTKMEKTKDVLRSDLMAIRAGRANPQLLDRITVDYYGTPTPLKNVANISAPEPRILQINPWDAKMVKDISRAIQASDLGLTPSNDGKVIRLMLPELTEERRKELTKLVRKTAEESKVAIRSIRRDAVDQVKKLKKNNEITEDPQKKAEEAALQAAKYHALMTLATYADKDLYARPQQAELAAAIQAGQEAIDAATTPQEVEEALTAAMTTIDGIKTLAELNKEKLPFTDVKEGDWYYRAVRYAVQQGLFKGVTDTTFAPNSKLNRAMAVTILYRLAGEPESTEQVTFTDVKEGAYYYKAVAWALENGITTGVDATRFAPNADVTREQMVTFLHRYAEVSGQDVNRMASLSSFRDAGSVSNYAREAMAWAVGNGILQGMEQDLLAPQGTATRAQAAAILMRFLTR